MFVFHVSLKFKEIIHCIVSLVVWRGEGRVARYRQLSQIPRALPSHGRSLAERSAAGRPTGHRKDYASQGCRRYSFLIAYSYSQCSVCLWWFCVFRKLINFFRRSQVKQVFHSSKCPALSLMRYLWELDRRKFALSLVSYPYAFSQALDTFFCVYYNQAIYIFQFIMIRK